MIILNAEKNRLTVQEKEPVTSGSVNVCPVRFQFSADWDGLDKTAVFQAGCREQAVALTGEACTIPAGVLAEPGHYLMAGVCGRRGETTVLPTVWVSLGLVLEGAAPGGDTPEPDPPSEDWQEALDGKGDALGYTDAGELGLYAGDKLLSSVPVAGGGGTDFIPGDGLSMEDGTLNADNPVRGVYTLAEWDALTEAQRARGTYFVDDGATCSDWVEYSTEERRIGTWIDGKPLYRKIIPFNSISVPYNSAITIETNTTIDLLVYGNWTGITSDGAIFANGCVPLYSGGRVLVLNNVSNGANPRFSGYATIEYTKTTDQATIELPAMLTVSQPLYTAAPASAASAVLGHGTQSKEVSV